VDNHHADLIVKILKEIYSQYGVDNEAIRKITSSVGGGNKKKMMEIIRRFKTEQFPSIAVTVDLLTTGIDVPEITTIVFMRRVKSRILFEQMMGRATRLCPEIHKTHFEIYDAVGVYASLEKVNTMKPVVANSSTTFTKLLDGLESIDDPQQVQYQINQIVAKMQRKKGNISAKTLEHFTDLTGGLTPSQFITDILEHDPIVAKKRLLQYHKLFEILQETNPNGGKPQVISDKEDHLLNHGRGFGNGGQPEDYLDAFADYIKMNMNEITALKIVCTRPRELTRESLKSLRLALDREGFTAQQLNTAISEVTNETIAADIISLIRRYAIGSTLISHEARIRRAIDKLRKAHNFSKIELDWLARIEKYMMAESVLNISVFEEDGRFKDYGGFAKINKVFQNNLNSIVMELNEYLYDDGGKSA
jgi:type I restriction enzyme R subunit